MLSHMLLARHPQVAILGVKKTVGPPLICAILWIFDIMFT